MKKNFEAIYSLAPAQQGMLLQSLVQKSTARENGVHAPLYIEQLVTLLHGPLDVKMLQQAWRHLMDRHPILKTAIAWKEQTEPLQIVVRDLTPPVAYEDYRTLSVEQQQGAIADFLRQDRLRPFDFSQPPLFRIQLFQVAEGACYMIWTCHHMLVDGWSYTIALQDLAFAYDCLHRGEEIRWPQAATYQDYITWLKQQNQTALAQFWRQELAGLTHPTPPGRSCEQQPVLPEEPFGSCALALSEETSTALQELCRRHHVTFNTLVQGIWALLLKQYSGLDDVTFGVTVSGRSPQLAGVESIVGPFLNTVPLRTKINTDDLWWHFLQALQLHHQSLSAYHHVSPGQIQQWSDISGSAPLFESIINFDNTTMSRPRIEAQSLVIEVVPEQSAGSLTHYTMTLLVQTEPTVQIELLYDAQRCIQQDIQNVLGHWERLMHGLLDNHEPRLRDLLALLPAGEVPALHTLASSEHHLVKPQISAEVDALEQIVASIWCEVLGIEALAAEENVFERGGHSLLIAQVVSRLRTVFNIDLPLRVVFESPTITTLAANIRQILSRMHTPLPAIGLCPQETKAELSFAQQRMWFLDRFIEEHALYNVYTAFTLRGSLQREALERSVQEIIRRHEVLRTAFSEREGKPCQWILPPEDAHISIQYKDVSEDPERLQQVMLHEMSKPFNLEQAPLVRVSLLQQDEHTAVLLIVIHHILVDGWSMDLFEHELTTLYNAFIAGKPSPLADLPLQYSDFSAWQTEQLRQGRFDEQLSYWKKQLNNAPLLALPTDYPRPAVMSYRGARQVKVFSPDLVARLKTLSQQEGVTLFMTMLAAFNVQLARYSGQHDISVGTPIAGRTQRELESLIGLFINTLVLRADLSGNPSFKALLARIRTLCLEAYMHQDIPFERVVEELEDSRESGRNPLFQVFFVMQQHVTGLEQSLQDIQMVPLELDNQTAKFDLSLYLDEYADGGMLASLQYSTDLFTRETAELFLAHFEAIVMSCVQQANAPIAHLSILTPAEQELLLKEWQAPFHKDRQVLSELSESSLCLHELVERQAALTPQAPALWYEHQQISYAELNRRAQQVAHTLQRRGVGPETRVSLYMERSPDAVIGLLAILKAGGAYVPLDPAHPFERNAAILADAQPHVILLQRHLCDSIPSGHASQLLIIEDIDKPLDKALEPLHSGVRPENLAYIIYTSGSTGVPKGVAGTHAGAVNYLSFVMRANGVTHTDKILQVASVAFDASLRDIIGPLSCGASIVLLSSTTAKKPAEWYGVMAEHQITGILSIVPSLLRLLLEKAQEEERSVPLRVLLTSGEPLTEEIVQRVRGLFGPTVRIVNQYGPTECSLTSTYYPVPAHLPEQGSIPLGRPIAGGSLYLLDESYQLTPIGVPGEIYIGGAGLTRGYWQRADLTAEAFIPHPYSDRPGERLYRTGDRAVYTAQGDLVFLGRRDEQVKILGSRVELGEVEAWLRQYPAFKEVAVVAEQDASGNRLEAYVVDKEGFKIDEKDIRHYLATRLPEYMIPGCYIHLDILPRTPNGKVDRKQLKALKETVNNRAEREVFAPRDLLELKMVEIWEQLLETRPIGIFDDFFALGGHSLKAIMLVDAIDSQFGGDLSLNDLYMGPTVADLCALLREDVPRQEKCLVQLQKGDASWPTLFLIHSQSGEVLSYFHLLRALDPNMTVYGLQAVGYSSEEPVLEDVEAMATRYIQEIREVEPVGPYHLAGWSFGGNVAFEMTRQLEAIGEQVHFLGVLDARAFGSDQLESWYLEKDEIVRYGIVSGVEEEELQDLDEEASIRVLLNHAKDDKSLPEASETETMRRMLRAFTANGQAAERYQYKNQIQADIYLFKAREKHAKLPTPPVDPSHWRVRTQGLLHEIEIPGTHHDFIYQPHVSTLAQLMMDLLRRIKASSAPFVLS